MPVTFSTQTRNFNTNLNSPIVAFDSGTSMPEGGNGQQTFTTQTKNFNINLNSPVAGF